MLISRLNEASKELRNRWQIARLNHQVANRQAAGHAPLVIFNASTRLTGLSLNAAFALLISWGLRLAGVPVLHFVCRSGMSHCVLGVNRQDFTQPPPCAACVAQSRRLYSGAQVRWFEYQADPELAAAIADLDVSTLSRFIAPVQGVNLGGSGLQADGLPLGEIALPSIRWTLRRHNLLDDAATRYLLRQFILSAGRVAQEFSAFLSEIQQTYGSPPLAVLIFNGMMYPEAVVRHVARLNGIRVVTHEVGFQKFSMFLTDGQATAYPLAIPDEFELTEAQNAHLDRYLEQRFQGKFTMAGIRFWPEMRGLDAGLLAKMERFRQVVPVFTNVVYDTSQVHANVVFPHMFAWLEQVLVLIRSHPETLFVIRAHPDEMRPGTKKQSNESVHQWVQEHGLDRQENVVFIDSQEYLSSYELVQRAKFVMVYNSSIGMEAVLLGRAVLCAGRARYTQYPIVHFPETIEAFTAQAETFLQIGLESDAKPAALPVPVEFQRNARRFLHYQLNRASLPMDRFLETSNRPGFVRLQAFDAADLLPEKSPAIRVLYNGLLHPREGPQYDPQVQPRHPGVFFLPGEESERTHIPAEQTQPD